LRIFRRTPNKGVAQAEGADPTHSEKKEQLKKKTTLRSKKSRLKKRRNASKKHASRATASEKKTLTKATIQNREERIGRGNREGSSPRSKSTSGLRQGAQEGINKKRSRRSRSRSREREGVEGKWKQ